jgi:hypothetical protein
LFVGNNRRWAGIGVGVQQNQWLAAQFYGCAAEHGHLDGAKNFGFCVEHGRGVETAFGCSGNGIRPIALHNPFRIHRLRIVWRKYSPVSLPIIGRLDEDGGQLLYSFNRSNAEASAVPTSADVA